jgi:two-component system nitrogen regulation response regulator GlnG
MSSLLVVDDEPAVLQLFRRVFCSQEFAILTAKTAEEGLRRVREEQPGVVVLDVLLPDSSGLDAYAEIRRIDPKLPVIFMTAGGASGTAIEAMKLGALDYMVKRAGRN